MIRRRSIMAIAGVLILVCCVGASGKAGAYSWMSWFSSGWTALSTTFGNVRLAAADLPLPQAPVDLSGFGRDYGMRPGSEAAGDFLGGFLGAGLGGLLSGDGFFNGMHGWPGVLGVIAQLLLIYSLIVSLYRRCTVVLAPAGTVAYARLAYPEVSRLRGVVNAKFLGVGSRSAEIGLNNTDFLSFEELLRCLQSAWSAQDIHALRSLTTPEMAEAYVRQVTEMQANDRRNMVRDLTIQRTEVIQASSDSRGDHVTVQFVYSMIDVTLDAWNSILEGSNTARVTVHENWKFTRNARGRWKICAIERVR